MDCCRLCGSSLILGAEDEHDVGCLRWEFCLAWYFVGQAAAQYESWCMDFSLAWLNIGTAAQVLNSRDERIGRLSQRLGSIERQAVTLGFNYERGRILGTSTVPQSHWLSGAHATGTLIGPDVPDEQGERPSTQISRKRTNKSPGRRAREVVTVEPVARDEGEKKD